MKDTNLNASNKKQAGKGNGNSIVSPKSIDNNAKNYVSGDAFPTSSGHQFDQNSQRSTNKAE